MILPAKFRANLGDRCIATRGLDHCLFVYPISEWNALEEKLRTLPLTSPDARAFSRFFFSGATECEIDNQGRIMLPQSLREYAAVNRDVVVIGVSTRIEVWPQERWAEYAARADANFEKLAEKMGEGGVFGG
jgi:MraZ protein